jgi:ABC-type Fe3+-hydroxamate transport system substrate-binding protein
VRPFLFSALAFVLNARPQIANMSYPLNEHIRDALGVYHAPHASPRIACLVPSITETLFALGLGDQVVARTGFCIHPEPAIREVPKVGGTKDIDLGKLIATEPTHVIVNIDENRKPDVEKIARTVPNVIVTHPLVPEDNVVLFQLLGQIFHREAHADELAQALMHALRDARELGAQLPSEDVLYLIWKKPWMTVSRDTYVSAMLATVGWRTSPIQATKRYPEIAEDDAIWRQVDRVLLSSEPYSFDESHASALDTTKGLKHAAQLIDGEYVSWYGVRAIEGLRYLSTLRKLPQQHLTISLNLIRPS